MDLSKLSVNEIKKISENVDLAEKSRLIEILKHDARKSVCSIAGRLEKDIEVDNAEIDRINKLKRFEHMYYDKGAKYIAGIDEVGRGPLAGPVYACAVILPIECIIRGVDDSKKLSPGKRETLSQQIRENAISWALGFCDELVIDEVNILNATYIAMKQAVENLKIKPQVLLIDAVRIPRVNIFQVPIIKGDSLSFSIAAASIVAKVERDKVMNNYDEQYPFYNFARNKGYGTKEHMEAIRKYGPCPIHRKTFIKGIISE